MSNVRRRLTPKRKFHYQMFICYGIRVVRRLNMFRQTPLRQEWGLTEPDSCPLLEEEANRSFSASNLPIGYFQDAG